MVLMQLDDRKNTNIFVYIPSLTIQQRARGERRPIFWKMTGPDNLSATSKFPAPENHEKPAIPACALTFRFKSGTTNLIIAHAVMFGQDSWLLIQSNITRTLIDQDQRATSSRRHKLSGSHAQCLVSGYSIAREAKPGENESLYSIQ